MTVRARRGRGTRGALRAFLSRGNSSGSGTEAPSRSHHWPWQALHRTISNRLPAREMTMTVREDAGQQC